MSIEAGKVYKVIQTDGKGLWWNTQGPNGNYGWFPANYVEVVQPGGSQPATIPSPQPVVQQQTQPQQTATTQSTLTAASFASSTPPTPIKTFKDKGTSPISVQLHIVTARGLKTDTSLSCHIFLYHLIEHGKDKDGRLVHKTSKVKKSKAPEWNEKFEVFINDPEMESVRVRLLSNKKKNWRYSYSTTSNDSSVVHVTKFGIQVAQTSR